LADQLSADEKTGVEVPFEQLMENAVTGELFAQQVMIC
jgi:hypothetical protein